MKLFYKGEFIKNISGEEAEKIYNYKGIQVMIDGELLKKSQLEIRKDEGENKDKLISDRSTEELKAIIGDFEKEYNENATGEVVQNDILGNVKEGTVKQALELGAITEYNIRNKKTYFVKLPEYNYYLQKYNAMRELISRREYAKEKSNEEIDKQSLIEKFSINDIKN